LRNAGRWPDVHDTSGPSIAHRFLHALGTSELGAGRAPGVVFGKAGRDLLVGQQGDHRIELACEVSLGA